MPRSQSTSKSNHSSVVPFRNPYSSVGNTSAVHVEQPTLGQSIKQGFGFGAGSAIAHRMFGMTPTIIAPSDKKISNPCDKELTAFTNCLKTTSTDGFCGEEQIAYTKCLNDPKNN